MPTMSFAPSNLKSDLSFAEVAFGLSFPLPVVEGETDPDPDPELHFLTKFGLGDGEDTGSPWVSKAGERGAVERPGNFLLNFILGMRRGAGTEKPAEAFGVGSTVVGVGVGRLPGVGVTGEGDIS